MRTALDSWPTICVPLLMVGRPYTNLDSGPTLCRRQNLAVTVLYVPNSLNSGADHMAWSRYVCLLAVADAKTEVRDEVSPITLHF